MNTAKHRFVRLIKSAYVTSCTVPTLEDQSDEGLAECNENGWRFLLRVVTIDYFYASGVRQYDTSLVSGRKQEGSTDNAGRSGKISL